MSQQVQGVFSRTRGAPGEPTTIVISEPGPGESVVVVRACGVCHTDLHHREGGVNDEFPFLLGHEAAGAIESVGVGVDGGAPGDFMNLGRVDPDGFIAEEIGLGDVEEVFGRRERGDVLRSVVRL